MNMSDASALRFYKLFGKLASAAADVDTVSDLKLIKELLNEITPMLRLSRIAVRIYRNPTEERFGRGETIICFDTGIEGNAVHELRSVTKLMSVVVMTVYMDKSEPALSDDEFEKTDLVARTVLAFISRSKCQDMVKELAFYDDDGFRNIRSFFNYLSWKGKPGELNNMSALNYNIRHFSLVNEEFGRNAGDKVLHAHYKHISDMIGEAGMISRLGGDAFVCICQRSVLPELLEYLTEAEVTFDQDGGTVSLTSSVGVFNIPDGYAVRNPNDIMGKIMHAYNIARNGGHQNIVFFDDHLLYERDYAKRIQQHFPEALRNREFHVFYQPKVNINGEMCGAEALCRWFRNGEIVQPIKFIPVLEETSDICKLDFFMLEQVCRHIRKWLDEGREVVRISVNLSRKHMMDSNLLTSIMEIIERYDIPHEYIEIELTETNTDVEFKDLQRIVGGLQKEKIYTSVDDFGIGYSSLNLIRVIPWNVIKVDRSFLPCGEENEDSVCNIMFKHVVSMAKEMGLECIVEGVETPAQLEVLRDNNCELAQGYLFDKPMPVEEFEKRLDMKRYAI